MRNHPNPHRDASENRFFPLTLTEHPAGKIYPRFTYLTLYYSYTAVLEELCYANGTQRQSSLEAAKTNSSVH